MKRLIPVLLTALVAASPLAAQINSGEAYDFLLGKMAEKSGNLDEAIKKIDKVIESTPGDPVLLYERSMLYVEASKLEKAEIELRKLIKLYPHFYDAERLLGRILLDRSGGDVKKVEEALVHLQEAYRLSPADLGTGAAVSQILVSLGRLDEAQKIVAALLEEAPDQRVLNFTYAQILTKLGRGDEARPYLERVVQTDPTYAPAAFQLVDIYQDTKEFDKAADTLEPLIVRDPLNLDLQRQQGMLYLRAGAPEKAKKRLEELTKADANDDRSAFFLAEALSDLGSNNEAEAIYQRLLKKTPSDPDLLVGLGLNLLAQQKYDEAERDFRSLLALEKLAPNVSIMARTQLALVELQRGNLDSALKQATEVLTFDHKPNIQAVNIALDVLRRGKKFDEAVTLIEPLRQQFPNNPYFLSRNIEFLVRGGQEEKARALAEAQLKLDPTRATAVAEAYGAAEKFDQGIPYLESLLPARPADRDLLFQLGSFYERAGRQKDAERSFMKVLDKDPRDAPTLNYLGYMWADKNQNLEKSAEMLRLAVDLEPKNGAYLDSLGWVYYRQGKLDLAEKFLGQASQLMPRDPTVQEHLGDVYAKRGEYAKALERYKTALDLEPLPSEEAELRNKLAETERLSVPRAH
ncbi:MAG: tetratricopeptide repeat protein [Acidobacteriota bacterium]